MKSLWKWCTVGVITVMVLSVLVGTPGGKAQDSGWTTQVLAEGPDAAKQRVITPDVAVVGDFVAVSYIQQEASPDKVCVTFSKDGGRSWTTVCFDEPARVISTSISAYRVDGVRVRICVAWIRLADWGPAVYQRCADVDELVWLSDPVLLSTEDVPAGQHDLQGDWTGNLDNTVAPDGTFYVVWSENYDTLKAAKSTDGVNWTACGDIPNQSGTDVRFPTIYVDAKGRVYAGATQTAAPDVQAWVSYDGCATWQGPTNVTSNGGFSDAPSFAVIGDKFYSVNDDTTTNPNNVDLNFAECDVTADAGLANCQGTRAVYKDAAWAVIGTDGKNLHLTGNGQGSVGDVVYCYSADGGATWIGDHVPDSKPNVPGIRDPDFGIIISRNFIAAAPNGGAHIVWMTRKEGKSQIMLSSRTAPPTGAAAATCGP